MTIYADMVFMINFIMDSFILWIVSKIVRKKIHPLLLLLGGLVMASLYCLLIFTAAFQYMNTIMASVLIISIGIALALRPSGFKAYCKMLVVAYLISFTIGGLGMVVFYLTDLPYAVYYLTADPVGFAHSLSWKLPVICVAASYVALKIGVRVAERITLKRQLLCPVQVFMGGEAITFDALVDTGHCLREPITQAPVIVAEFERIKAFLPEPVRLLFYENHENDLNALLAPAENPSLFYSRVRMIPFSSLGRANGMLIGFRPDRVAVSLPKNETTRNDVVIGIYNSRLSQDGRYQGLLSPELIAVS